MNVQPAGANTPRRTESFFITRRTRCLMPALPWRRLKEDILGRAYVLSLVFVGERRARALNRSYRKKTYAPNVLAFPLASTRGEIFITPTVALREASQKEGTPRAHLALLFIHGLLHLKGCRHGDTMERIERRFLRRYHLG